MMGPYYRGNSDSVGLYGSSSSFGGTYFEWFIFQEAATAPATPTGGSWSFTTNVGTPPTGWSSTPPASPTNIVWVSIALVNSRNTNALTWSVPGQLGGSGGGGVASEIVNPITLYSLSLDSAFPAGIMLSGIGDIEISRYDNSTPSIRLGNNTVDYVGSAGGVAIGNGAAINSNGVAIGPNANANNDSSFPDAPGNVAIGANSVAGHNGIAVGDSATSVGSNAISIGNNAFTSGDNAISLNATGTFQVVLNSGFYVNPVRDDSHDQNDNGILKYDSTTGEIYTSIAGVSDLRDKTDFAPVPHGLNFVNQLKPTTYRYKANRNDVEGYGPLRYGFKAQDVLELEGSNPVIVDAKDAEKLRFNEQSMIAVLVNAIQELSEKFEAYKATHP